MSHSVDDFLESVAEAVAIVLLVSLLRTYHHRAKSKGAVDLCGVDGEDDVTITFDMGDSAFTIRVQGPEFYEEEDAALNQ